MLPPSRKPPLRIDLAELETFIAVAELGSFSAAAQLLHLGQPSVTSRVQRLEATLGTRLLVRSTRKVETTADGARLVQEGNAALDALRDLAEDFRQGAQRARQRVVVASTPVMAATILPSLIRDYAARFTDVEVKLLDLSFPEITASLEKGEADVAVVSDLGDGRFHSELLGSDTVVLAVPANHPMHGRSSIAVQELPQLDILMIELYRPLLETVTSALQARGLPPPRVGFVSNLTTLSGMLDAGLGVGLMAFASGRRRQAAGDSIASIDGLDLRRNYGLLYPRKSEPGTAVLSFCHFLRQSLKDKWPLDSSLRE